MAKILGLDLGSGSIGWAVINYADNYPEMEIWDLGCRIVPIDGETLSKFDTGQSITINSSRTTKRTMRKMLNRSQDRKKDLLGLLNDVGLAPDDQTMALSKEVLWQLRAKAATERLSPAELGRVLLHISQKRGYNASRTDLASEDKKTGELVSGVRKRYLELKESGKTVGQFYYDLLRENPDFRVKGQVLPRQAYIEEFDAIMECQAQYHPALTERTIHALRDEILFYQRPLKSCKHLVGTCEFESKQIVKDGKTVTVGPKVAHKSNPLFQLSRLWQVVNAIALTNRYDPKETYVPNKNERLRLFNHLQHNDKLKVTDIYALLFNKKNQKTWIAPDNIGNGVPGNRTLLAITKALGGKYKHLLEFDTELIEDVDTTTGDVKLTLRPDINEQPLYQLWHVLYSIKDVQSLKKTLANRFGIDDATIEQLLKIDFSNDGYGSMSEKAIKRILPYLMQGHVYSDACQMAGFKHSQSLTAQENAERTLLTSLPQLKKGELRQPIVEKILNQLVNLVNSLMERYGEFDEIHIELARELKQSREQRNKKTLEISNNEKENERIAKRIKEEYGLTPNKTRINKLKLWEETGHLCIYCNQPVSATEFLNGYDVEVEHIVPKSLLFDDSFSNKACACRKCNHAKGNMTAYDYMSTLGDSALKDYMARVNQMKTDGKISQTKLKHLLMSADEIPDDFINRQLQESQYIARKAMDMLQSICRTVVATSGSVTAYLRHTWGWDQVLHDLNVERYAKADLVEATESHPEGRIKDWSKRCDHRHHAIDALTIACTTRAVIQRLNNLNTLKDKKFTPFLQKDSSCKSKQTQLEQYVNSLPHFTYEDVRDMCAKILVSLKQSLKFVSSGKRYTYFGGKRRCVQQHISIPRGPLHEETIMGKIKRYDAKGNLQEFYVIKCPLSKIRSLNDASSIVDSHIRVLVTERLKSVKDPKSAFVEPLYSDKGQTKRIKSVRRFTGASMVMPVRKDEEGRDIGFALAGANHHVAIYEDANGKLHEHIASFKHCVDRHTYGFPAIIHDPAKVWSDILSGEIEYPQSFLSQLPKDGWNLKLSMQRNEVFLLGATNEEVSHAIEKEDREWLNHRMYRLQSLSSNDYQFALHTQTKKNDKDINKPDLRFIRIRSLKGLNKWNPIKLKIGILGEIVVDKT